MKQGIESMELLTKQVMEEANARQDFIADTRNLELEQDNGLPVVSLKGHGVLHPNEIFHAQTAESLKMPKRYYDRMLNDHPDILLRDVNALWQREPSRRMVRTLSDKARANLSDKYHAIDHDDVLAWTLPLLSSGGVSLASCEVTERRLYIKATFPAVQAEITTGDVVESGVMLTNSEVGLGAVNVQPFIHRLVCKNGMVANEAGLRKMHLGRRMEEGQFFKYETRQQTDKAFLMQLRDLIGELATEAGFARIVEKMREAANRKIEGDPAKAVEVVKKKSGLLESEKDAMFRHFIEGGDLSQWGVANAVTRTANDVESYDRATTLESIGGEIITLAPTEWREIATAT